MSTAETRHPTHGHFRLMSASSAKRWGWRFVLIWLGMWLSTALLPCAEVEAAIAAHEQALHTDCRHPADRAPDSGRNHKTAPCNGIDAPAPASGERLASSTSGKLIQPALGVSASLHIFPPPARTIPRAYRAAPPPVAVYLRISRLLI